MAETQVKVPKVGKVDKKWVWGAIGVVGVYVAYRWYSAGAGSAADTTTTTPDVGAGIDASGVVGAGGASGNVQYAGTTTDGTSTTVLNTNADWTNKAVELLSNAGYDPSTVYAALGDYLASRPLTSSEQTIVRASLAAAGNPPVGGPYVIREQVGPVTLTAPTGLKVVSTTANTVTLSWNKVNGAGYYRAYREGVATNVGATDGTTVTVGGLEPNKSYRFKVAADTTTGKPGPSSGWVTAKTKGMSLAKAATPRASAVKSRSFRTTTTAVKGATLYEWFVAGRAKGKTELPYRDWTDAAPNTTYKIQVRADTVGGNPGPLSGTLTVKTKK